MIIERTVSSVSKMERRDVASVFHEVRPKLISALQMSEREFSEQIEFKNGDVPAGIDPASYSDMIIPQWDIDLRASTWADVPCAKLDTNDPEQAAVIASGRFRLRLAGDCMEPDYADGQVIEFQIIRADRDPLEVGRDYCWCRNDDSATFKRLAKINDDDYSLAAINQRDFPGVIVVPKQEICRIAKVLYRLQPPPEARVPKIGKGKR